MAGEYDDKFEEITGLLHKTVGGLDELRMEVRDLRNDVGEVKSGLRENTSGLMSLTQKVDLLSNHFKDVAGVVIKDHHPRIEHLEERVGTLEAEAH
jgi:hypothetical protein